ncbi:glycosyltransferase family 2 protein [Roseomonas sp. HJA6]|uniref:Glycosyltransferase family 2 protein n=1 Tax=Roseomonas alba TaxID=2846776 RepID=A0ABS7A2G7_9PROT|nr:glycosyltransferase family 2 protein [Neoroseomonas alba]
MAHESGGHCQDPDLAIVIISHGHDAMLPACIASLQPALTELSSEIVVIDNLPDGAAAKAVAGFDVHVLRNDRSVGFAANVNRGAAATTAPFLLFLNPDTEHREGRLIDAIRFLDEHPRIGLLGCTLVSENGTLQQNFRRFPSPAVPIARGFGAEHWPWRPAWYTRATMPMGRRATPFAVDWIFGAFLLMRRADFERVGGMDERYRLYYEDVDLAWRLRRAGLATWIFPAIRFLHVHQRASARRPFSRAWCWHVGSALRYFAPRVGHAPPPLMEPPDNGDGGP